MKLLGYDSILISLLTKISKLLVINIMWLLCSLPLFTIGASTTAMYAVTMAMAENRGGNVVVAFLRAFRDNFRDGTKVFGLMAVVGAVLLMDCYVLLTYEFPGGMIATPVTVLLLIIFAMVWTLAFPITARYKNTARKIIKSAFQLCTQNFYKTLFMVLFGLLPVFLLLLSPELFVDLSIYWVLLGFAVAAYIDSLIILRIFAKNDRANGIEETTESEC